MTETRYCAACDNRGIEEWTTDDEGKPHCFDCDAILFDDYGEYRDGMVEWLGDRKGMPEGEVLDFLTEHGNPLPIQALAILASQQRADADESLASGVNSDDLRLDCSECHGLTQPRRKEGDPETVVRCGRCGRKHSTDSLRVVSNG